MLRVTHEFTRIEAISAASQVSRLNERVDPLSLEVRVDTRRPGDREYITIESATYPSAQANKPFRLANGVWAFDLNEKKYLAGQSYVVLFRYEMTPGNVRVDRYPFVYWPVPDLPRTPSSCIVHGQAMDIISRPVPDFSIMIEEYDDAVTLTNRRGLVEVKTDLFGVWQAELLHGHIYRFVAGQKIRTIKVPPERRARLADIPDLQVTDVQKDRFGHPFPNP